MTGSFRRHSAVAQAAYQDLLARLLDEAVAEIRGTPTPRERGGRTYWYDRYRLGTVTRERYLGEDSEALRAALARHAEAGEGREERRRERARLVRLLRSERFLGLDTGSGSLITALARVGFFRLGGVLVGTAAFRVYEGELGFRLSLDETAMTDDIDVASFERLSLALEDAVTAPLADVFKELDFEPVPDLERGKVWRWRQARGSQLVEFLTPSFTEEEGVRDLKALGVAAQSLHHLNYLLADPIPAAGVYRDGILLSVPRPERFAIHKLIVADRRRGRDRAKARKDLAQAEFLSRLLAEDRPDDLVDAYEDAVGRGPRWRMRIERSLARCPAVAEAIARSRSDGGA